MPFKKIKSPLNDDKTHGWIKKHYPNDFEDMLFYVEPCCNSTSTFLNKTPSTEEAINYTSPREAKTLRTIRDHYCEFIDYLKKVKCTKSHFENELNKKIFTNDLEEAANEFILRNMSKNGEKEVFQSITNWRNMINDIEVIAARLDKVYIFNKSPSEIIKAFNSKNVFIYLEFIEEPKLIEMVRTFKGKALVLVDDTHSRLFKSTSPPWPRWRHEKVKNKVLWINY